MRQHATPYMRHKKINVVSKRKQQGQKEQKTEYCKLGKIS